jgi:hypothetical protein
MGDTITRYVLTAAAGVRYFCAQCHVPRVIWTAETLEGDTITGCSICNGIILRKRTADIPQLKTN